MNIILTTHADARLDQRAGALGIREQVRIRNIEALRDRPNGKYYVVVYQHRTTMKYRPAGSRSETGHYLVAAVQKRGNRAIVKTIMVSNRTKWKDGQFINPAA